MSNMENKTKPYFIPILRLIELVPNSVWEEKPHKKEYIEKLIKYLENEGYVIDAKLVNEKLRAINGEKVAWATMDKNEFNIDCLKEVNSFSEPRQEEESVRYYE